MFPKIVDIANGVSENLITGTAVCKCIERAILTVRITEICSSEIDQSADNI
jgi:hypothetical protein